MTGLLPHYSVDEEAYIVMVECLGHFIMPPKIFFEQRLAEEYAQNIIKYFMGPIGPYFSDIFKIPLTTEHLKLMNENTVYANVYKYKLQLLPYRSLVGAEKGFSTVVDFNEHRDHPDDYEDNGDWMMGHYPGDSH